MRKFGNMRGGRRKSGCGNSGEVGGREREMVGRRSNGKNRKRIRRGKGRSEGSVNSGLGRWRW